jgi:hypothetical protein
MMPIAPYGRVFDLLTLENPQIGSVYPLATPARPRPREARPSVGVHTVHTMMTVMTE